MDRTHDFRNVSENARCPDNLCKFFALSGTQDEKEKIRIIHSMLHDYCEKCTSEAVQEPLCDICRHLRLRHLTTCLRQSVSWLYFQPRSNNDFNRWISRIMSNTECPICSVLANAINTCITIRQETDEHEEYLRKYMYLELELYQTPGVCRLILGLFNGYRYEKVNIDCLEPSRDWKPDIEYEIHWPTIQQWILNCTSCHQCRRSEHPTIPPGFRLIDVDKRELVSNFGPPDFPIDSKLGRDIRFVALSYVWGNTGTSGKNALMMSNKHELTVPGGLGKLSLAKAIEDAMTVCQKLQQRFLWVDRFCIQQDGEVPERQAQINAMGDIYSSAELTIIHASGTGIEDPIPGVTTPRKVLQSRAVACGFELISGYPDIDVQIKKSKWKERGWTYQEAVLSHRKLFFTPFELWFECSDEDDAYRREERCSGQRISSQMQLFEHTRKDQYKLNSGIAGMTKFHEFARHLKSYTARSLTHQSDILDAFKGILQALYPGDPSIYGLPETDFDQAMLWYCEKDKELTVGASSFPSWSWPSVNGEILVPTTPLRMEREGFVGTLVEWYHRDQNGELKMLKIKSKSRLYSVNRLDTSAQAHLLVAWWKGCIEPAVPEDVKKQFEDYPVGCKHCHTGRLSFLERLRAYINIHPLYCTTCESEIARRWPSVQDVWKDIRRARCSGPGITHYLMASPQEERKHMEHLQSGVLLTRGQTTYFKMAIHSKMGRYTAIDDLYKSDDVMYFVNREDQRVGKTMSGYADMRLKEFLVRLKSNSEALEAQEGVCVECMGISTSVDGIWGTMVNVLIIHREKGSPFWRRLGVGQIEFEAWFEAQRVFKTIYLQ
ncbi:HET-domain-containing protein [Xylaria arbuscula]|nr:HET-domain-containing protein [Xylaria arbuscula]